MAAPRTTTQTLPKMRMRGKWEWEGTGQLHVHTLCVWGHRTSLQLATATASREHEVAGTREQGLSLTSSILNHAHTHHLFSDRT